MPKLNTLQKAFFDKATSLDFQYLVLTGKAGTGKTFTISQVIRFFIKNKILFTVCAPTYQAGAVLQAKIDNPDVTVKTVASVVGSFGFQTPTGDTIFTKGSANKVKSHGIVLVDELSAVSKGDIDALRNAGLKIIGIGDQPQLGPVMAKANDLFDTGEVFMLTEQMRAGGEIYRVADECRDKVYHPTQSKGNVTVWNDPKDHLEEFLTQLERTKTTGQAPTDFIYLSYRNTEVERIAALAHQRLYGAEDFVIGQTLRLEENHPGTQAKGHPVIIREILGQTVIDSESVNPQTATIATVANPQTDSKRTTLVVLPPAAQKVVEKRLERQKAKIVQAYELGDMKSVKLLRDAYDRLDTSFNRVSSPFSLTVHKSQGMSTPHVFVNNRELGNRRALLYVGMSRASKHLHTVRVPLKIKCLTPYQMWNQTKKNLFAAQPEWYKPFWDRVVVPAHKLGYSLKNDEGREYCTRQLLEIDTNQPLS